MRSVRGMPAVAVIVALSVAVAPRPAYASCAASPSVSPYRFDGVVLQVTNLTRTALVRTDNGRVVTVRGSDAEGPNAATSVDRGYQVGVRYEFDPENDSSPYRDNALYCDPPARPGVLPDAEPGRPEPHRVVGRRGGGGTAGRRSGGLAVAAAGQALALMPFRRFCTKSRTTDSGSGSASVNLMVGGKMLMWFLYAAK
jgi:hypothetical protein